MKEDNAHASASELLLIEPANSQEWEEYFHLRWTVLRQPWNQPRGSERDERENDSVQLMICDTEHHPIAIGRLHFNSPMEAQIRFMAVTPRWQHSGLGSRILRALERRAKVAGAASVVLNSRDGAVPFYQKHGYKTEQPAETLFGQIAHIRMRKEL
jgi:N-acetylglutamate synthase-like GNAT family acetyltransferase